MMSKLIRLLPCLLAAGSLAQPQSPPIVKERPSSHPISDNPVVNPSSSKQLPQLPPAAVATQGSVTETGEENWEKAQWSTSQLRVSGTADKTVAVASPSLVLVKLASQSSSTITLSLLKDGSVLGSAKSSTTFSKQQVATILVKIPSAGNIVVRTAVAGPVDVQLYIGVLGNTTP